MQERIEFETFNQFLEQAARVKVMYSRDETHFFNSYEGMQNYYDSQNIGDILLGELYLMGDRKYYVIKANE